jgi:mRNA interferase RelE/StbE
LKVKYRKPFLTELARIPSGPRRAIEVFAFEEAPKIDSVGASGKIQRMKGYQSSYKVRFGSYRIGLTIEEDTLVFERALHRKDIYRFFP